MKNLILKIIGFFLGVKSLTADAILSAVDVKLEKISVPEWGGFIYLRRLAVDVRIEYLRRMSAVLAKSESDHVESNKEYFDAQIYLLVRSITDAKGVCIFSDVHMEALTKKSPDVISRLCDRILLLNEFQVAAIEDHAKK